MRELSSVLWLLIHLSLSASIWVGTTHILHLTDERFISLSLTPSLFLNKNNYSTVTKNLLKGLAPSYLRIGGPESDKPKLRITANLSDESTPTKRNWELLYKLAEDTGVKVVFVTVTRPRTTEGSSKVLTDVQSILQFAEERQFTFVPNFQLGYVAQMKNTNGTAEGLNVVHLRKILNLYPRYHSAAVLGPDFASCISPDCIHFLKDFLLCTGHVINTLVIQLNPMSDLKEDELVFKSMSRLLDATEKKLTSSNNLTGGYQKNIPKKQLWIAEAGAEGYSGGFSDALVWALRLGHAARLGYDVILRCLNQMDYPTPDYWVSLLYRRLVGRAVLDILSPLTSSVMLFAHCTTPRYSIPGAVTVWGVNAAETSSTITLPHQHAFLYALTAGPTSCTRRTFLNGEELRMTPSASLPGLNPHEISAKQVSLPPFSVFFIVLPNMKAPACFPTSLLLQRNTNPKLTSSFLAEPTYPVNLLTDKTGLVGSLLGNRLTSQREHDFISDPKVIEGGLLKKGHQISPFDKSSVLTLPGSKIQHSGGEHEIIYEHHKDRSKRSEPNYFQEIFETSPLSLRNTANNVNRNKNRFNIFNKLEALSKMENHDSFQKPSRNNGNLNTKYYNDYKTYEAPEGNNINSIRSFPRGFYNNIQNFLFQTYDKFSDVEDLQEGIAASITKNIPCSSQRSRLTVTRRLPSDEVFDQTIVERTAKKMDNYFKNAYKSLNRDIFENEGQHECNMKCCTNENIVEESFSASKATDTTRFTKGQLDTLARDPEPQNNISTNKILKDRVKRNTESLGGKLSLKTDKSNSEASYVSSLDKDKVGQLLAELREEGEKILLSYNQEFEKHSSQTNNTLDETSQKDIRLKKNNTHPQNNKRTMTPNLEKFSAFNQLPIQETPSVASTIKADIFSEVTTSKFEPKLMLNKNKSPRRPEIIIKPIFDQKGNLTLENKSISGIKDTINITKLGNQETTVSLLQPAHEVLINNNLRKSGPSIIEPRFDRKHNLNFEDAAKSINYHNNVNVNHIVDQSSRKEAFETHSSLGRTTEIVKPPSTHVSTVYNHFTTNDLPVLTPESSLNNNFSGRLHFEISDDNLAALEPNTSKLFKEQTIRGSPKLIHPVNRLERVQLKPMDFNHQVGSTLQSPLQLLISNIHRQRMEALKDRLKQARQRRSHKSDIKHPMLKNALGAMGERVSRSITSCVKDRFSDFQSENEGISEVLPVLQKRIDMKTITNYDQIGESKDKGESNESKLSLNGVSRAKRSVIEDAEINEIDTSGLITDYIVKHEPTSDFFSQIKMLSKPQKKSVIDNMYELARQYNLNKPTSLEIFSSSSKENKMDHAYVEKGKKHQLLNGIDSSEASEHILTKENILKLPEELTFFNKLSPVTDRDRDDVLTNSTTNISNFFQNNFISSVIKKVNSFFSSITSLIKDVTINNL